MTNDVEKIPLVARRSTIPNLQINPEQQEITFWFDLIAPTEMAQQMMYHFGISTTLGGSVNTGNVTYPTATPVTPVIPSPPTPEKVAEMRATVIKGLSESAFDARTRMQQAYDLEEKCNWDQEARVLEQTLKEVKALDDEELVQWVYQNGGLE